MGWGLVATTSAAATTAATTATAVFTARSTAAAATAATAWRTVFTGTCNVDGQCAAVQLFTIQCVNGSLSLFGRAHGDETKTAGTAANAVHHQVGFHDSAVRREGVLQVVLGGVEGKISHKQFRTHLMSTVLD